MLIYLYWISSIIVVLIILKQEKIDVKTIFGLSTILYGLPLFTGETGMLLSHDNGGIYYKDKIDYKVYIIYLLSQLSFIIVTSFSKSNNVINKKEISKSKIYTFFYAIFFTFIIYLILFIMTTGVDTLMIPDKNERISQYSVFYFYTSLLSVVTILFYIIYPELKVKVYLTFPILYLLFDLINGNRTFLFLGIISFILAYFSHEGNFMHIKNKLKFTFYGLITIIIAFLYKPIYFAIKNEDFNVSNISLYVKKAFYDSEPFIILSSLNAIVKEGVYLPENYLFISVIQYIPFYETLTQLSRETFNYYFQSQLFPIVKWGLASTSYGELYTLGGFFAIIIFLLLISLFLKIRLPNNIFFLLMYFYVAPYITFYYHRNDWNQFISVIRHFGISFIGVLFVYVCLRIIPRKKLKIKK